MSNKDTGFFGETKAAAFLISKGYSILYRNWRYKHLELDIIAAKDGLLHIVEVKTRSSVDFGFPEKSIDKIKMQYLKNAAAMFQYKYPVWKYLQFDVIAIFLNQKKEWELNFFEDVYF
jgi:putative endonuclease